jgi:hypothetical protein
MGPTEPTICNRSLDDGFSGVSSVLSNLPGQGRRHVSKAECLDSSGPLHVVLHHCQRQQDTAMFWIWQTNDRYIASVVPGAVHE